MLWWFKLHFLAKSLNKTRFLISAVLFCHCPTSKFLKPSPTQMELVGNSRLDNRRGSTAAGMQTLWWISQICRPLSSYLINFGCCGKREQICLCVCLYMLSKLRFTLSSKLLSAQLCEAPNQHQACFKMKWNGKYYILKRSNNTRRLPWGKATMPSIWTRHLQFNIFPLTFYWIIHS